MGYDSAMARRHRVMGSLAVAFDAPLKHLRFRRRTSGSVAAPLESLYVPAVARFGCNQ